MTRTREEIKKIVNDLGYELLDEYTPENRDRRVIIQDKIGYKYDVRLVHLMNKNHLPNIVDIHNPYSLENIVLWLFINRPEFELCKDNTYKGSNKNLKLYHNIFGCKEYFYINWDCILQNRGCAVCHGLQVGERTSLAYLRPQLMKEWHPDNNLIPEEIPVSSGKRVYWVCSVCNYGENKEWFIQIYRRTGKQKEGCPACAGKVVTNRNRLSILFPEISLEWDYNKNKDTPYDVSFGKNVKRWWICPNGHEYFSLISSRTCNGNGCKQCANERQESEVATRLKEWCKETFGNLYDPEHPILRSPKDGILKCDIYIGHENTIDGVYIEVNGKQHYILSGWHKHKAKRKDITSQEEFEYAKRLDKIKKQYAKKHGKYIEIDLRKIKTAKEAIEYVKSKIY